MSFGLKNAPATFQRLMDVALSGLQGRDLFVYLDDIVIYVTDITEHENKFRSLAKRLNSAGLKAQASNRTRSTSSRLKTFQHRKTKKGIKQFVALAGYRQFIYDFEKIAIPLTQQLKKSEKFKWTNECQSAFEYLKAKII